MKDISNLKWAHGLMEELGFGDDELWDWRDDFKQYCKMLSEGPLKGGDSRYIKIVAMKLTILNDGNDVGNAEFTIDKTIPDEPHWENFKIKYWYGS